MTNPELTVGKLARLAGVGVETIRYYQQRGLLFEPKKQIGSVRRYSETDVSRIHFIKSAQRLGFTLEEISLLLKLEDGTHCVEAKEIAEQKLVNVRSKLADLKIIEKALSALVKKCDINRGSVCCPLIDSIQHGPESIN
jgi:MerR family mercuric resistance operon transcriptional regulator